ncbi:MAG TPA: SDR family oxidoreductase [Gemmatimonadaceae bacterium]|nr:SDR family oxidoreductase [Gemmatimonadaceae bacterium]
MDRTAAIVTGHSRGLGEAIAHHLLSRGVRVLGISRRGNPGLAKRHAALAELQIDLADALVVAIDAAALGKHFRDCDTALLVNNAGVLQPAGPLETQGPDAVTRAIVVNVAAPLALCASFVAASAHARDRRIVHISSGAGRNAYAGWSVYCASKAALDHHARAVALDKTPNLRICAVAPGVIDTDMQAEVRNTSEDKFPDRERFVELKREGRLLSADRAGHNVVEVLLSESFGREAVIDLRN